MPAKFLSMDSVQTRSQLQGTALRVADVLRERGVSAGDRVVLKAGNSAGFVAVLLGLMHIGASVALLDQLQRAEESGRAAAQARARLAVVDDDAPEVPGPPRLFVYELLAAAAERRPTDEQIRFDTWERLPDALITWSSGSTGEPKGIVKSGRPVLRNLRRTIEFMRYRADDVLLPLLPFSHQYGLSLLLIAWLADASLVVAPYRRLDRAVRMAGQAGVTVVDATPATHRSLLNLVERRPELAADLSGVRMYCTGGAPLDQSAAARFATVFGRPLLDGYGSTEMGNIAAALPENPVGAGQVFPGVVVRITDDAALPLPPGAIGELRIRTPDAFSGYLSPGGEIVPAVSEWYSPGDLGSMDGDGNLFVLGRKSAVHRMGYTLYPDIIERKAAECGAPVQVVPQPDERLGSRLVFLVEDPEERASRYWRERICELLPAYEQPNKVVVVGKFPLNHNGKTDTRRILRLADSAVDERTEAADALSG
ncbi:class I adenylate-forming enzyme family protein [Streptomyces sp. NRRL F-5135]|uniref:class I adenylate-forming enzyme family protein n=1 Tax=Streptomyces sp. NRRL F-5135 TaxID=1463858 RepID=UPI0004CC4AA5|nr:class I adenylate-forming enzyme family protein [Streptomyces sp. NRRL F-5135]